MGRVGRVQMAAGVLTLSIDVRAGSAMVYIENL